MLTLWDLIDPLLSRLASAGAVKPVAKVPAVELKPAAGVVAQAAVAEASQRGRSRVVVRPSVTLSARPAAPAADLMTTVKRGKARSGTGEHADASMQAKYDAVVATMLDRYQIRVRKWRTNMSGVAWYVTYRDGKRVNLIESPRPKGPMSAAVFLHEIGHHAIGFDVYKPRCLEEFHAWKFSLEAMEQCGLNITDAVRLRMHRSLHYAVAKAVRRGIKSIPAELEPFLVKPPARRRRG